MNRGLTKYPGEHPFGYSDESGREALRKLFFMPRSRLETIPIPLVILWLLGYLV